MYSFSVMYTSRLLYLITINAVNVSALIIYVDKFMFSIMLKKKEIEEILFSLPKHLVAFNITNVGKSILY